MSDTTEDATRTESVSSGGKLGSTRGETDLPDISVEDQREIMKLARRLTVDSTRGWHEGIPPNPFISIDHPSLDPNSPMFNARHWAKAVLQLTSQDPHRFPQRTAGVSFRHLSVHGYGRSTAYQKDFLNAFLQVLDLVGGFINRNDRKLQILEDHDGLLRSGEMLLVLGRPGR